MSQPSNQFADAASPARDFCAVVRRQWRVGLLVCLLSVLYLVTESRTVPPTYRAVLKLRATSDKPTFAMDVAGSAYASALQAQSTMIGSQSVLRGVALSLQLPEQWNVSEDEAVDRLTCDVSVRPTRDREMIQIEGRSVDRALALSLPDAVFSEFVRQMVAGQQQQSVEALDKLRAESERQYRLMRVSQDRLLDVRAQLAGRGGSTDQIADARPNDSTQLSAQIAKLRSEISDGRWRVEMLRVLGVGGARAEQLLMLHDAQADRLLEQVRTAEQELAQTRSRCSEQHPAVARQTLALGSLRTSLENRIDEVIRGQRLALEVQTARLQSLEWQKRGGDSHDAVATIEQACDNAAMEAELQTKLYQSLRDRVQKLSIESQFPSPLLQVIDRPARATLDASRRLCDMPYFSGALAILLGIIAARIADAFDASVRSASDAAATLGVPLFASISGRPRQIDDAHTTPEQIEAYRMVVARLRFADPQNHVRTLAVVSVNRGEGRSVTVANLACLYAAQGQRVLVIDTDLPSASMHKSFDVAPAPGLTDFLEGTAVLDDVIVPTNISNIWLTPAGTSGLKTSPSPLHIAALTRQAERRFDLVIYDTAPLCSASDAAIVAREAHHVLYVVRAGACSRKALAATSELLSQAACTVLGAVFVESRRATINLRPEPRVQPVHYSIARTRVMRERVQTHEQAKSARAKAA